MPTIVFYFIVFFIILVGETFSHESITHQIEDVTKAIQQDARNVKHYWKRATLYRLNEDYDAALADVKIIKELDEKDMKVHLLLAQIYHDSQKYENAMVAVTKFLVDFPKHTKAYWLRAQIFEKQKKLLEASHDYAFVFNTTSRLEPKHVQMYANALVEAGELLKALGILEQGMERLGALLTLQTMAIDLERKLLLFDEALQRIAHLEHRSPRKSRWLALQGDVLVEAKRYQDALNAYQKALNSMKGEPKRLANTSYSKNLMRHIQQSILMVKNRFRSQ